MTAVPSPEQQISLCMIVRDEARDIVACLDSARDLVSEMIVVDTGSQDTTVALAEAAGARVEHFRWCDDFAAARNASLSYAINPWVLVLDADERLTKSSVTGIRDAVSQGDFVCGLIRLHDANSLDASAEDVVAGKARLGELMFVPRLLKRTEDLAYEGIVHESLRQWLRRHDNQSKSIDADLIHFGAVPSLRRERGKSDRNTKLLKQRLALEPNDFTIHGYLAHELIAAGDEEGARSYIEQGWDLVRTSKPNSLSSALRLAAARALLQFKRGDVNGALDTATVGLAYEGFQPDLSFFAGHAHELLAHRADSPSKRSTHYKYAREAYRACLTTRGKVLAQRYVRGVSSWMSMTRLGTVQLLTGEGDAALRSFEDALQEEPSLDEASLGRAQAMVELGRGEQALEALDPFLDPSQKSNAPMADAWLIAAHAANQMGSIDDLKMFLEKARSFSQEGYRYAHHNRLHGSLHCQLLCLLGQPTGGLGTIGTAGALMSGSPPAQAWTIEAGERHTMQTFIRNLLLTGNSALVDALLHPDADQSLPGVTDLVRGVVRALGMTVEEQ